MHPRINVTVDIIDYTTGASGNIQAAAMQLTAMLSRAIRTSSAIVFAMSVQTVRLYLMEPDTNSFAPPGDGVCYGNVFRAGFILNGNFRCIVFSSGEISIL